MALSRLCSLLRSKFTFGMSTGHSGVLAGVEVSREVLDGLPVSDGPNNSDQEMTQREELGRTVDKTSQLQSESGDEELRCILL